MSDDPAKNRQAIEELGPGTVLGRYQLLAAVGEGGMGRVWAARQVGSPLQRLVAVKTALRSLGLTREFQRLFMDEARIASLIQHPHVCGVYELGEERGAMFLVMEWCDGASLRQVMDRLPEGKMQPELAARIVANVAAGLHAAHELEDNDGTPLHVVHRDVSPQNVLISSNGHVKVADFGVAKARGQLHKPTETGEMKGKLSYMAPEQVTAKDVDRRADIFALGCILYETTLGRRPFHGEGALSTLYQLLEQTVVPPADILPQYPEELAGIVLKALRKDPDERYQTAEQLRVALEGWLTCSAAAACGEREIAGLLQNTVGDQIKERSGQITAAIDTLSRPKKDPRNDHQRPSAAAVSVTPKVHLNNRSTNTEERGIATGAVRREQGSSWWLPAAAGLLVLAIAAFVARDSFVASQLPAAPPVSSTVASQERTATDRAGSEATSQEAMIAEVELRAAAPSPEPELAPVTIRVESVPPGALVQLDGAEPRKTPFSLSVPRGEAEHRLTAQAEGYRQVEQNIVFDQDRTVMLSLAPDTPRQVVRKPRQARTKKRAHEPRKTRTKTARAVTRAAAVTTKAEVPKRRKRTLDEENPFD